MPPCAIVAQNAAIGADPLRVDEAPADQRHDDDGGEQQAEDRQHGVGDRREEVRLQPGARSRLALRGGCCASAISVRT